MIHHPMCQLTYRRGTYNNMKIQGGGLIEPSEAMFDLCIDSYSSSSRLRAFDLKAVRPAVSRVTSEQYSWMMMSWRI